MLLAKAARIEGAKIFEKTPVEKILIKNGRIAGRWCKNQFRYNRL